MKTLHMLPFLLSASFAFVAPLTAQTTSEPQAYYGVGQGPDFFREYTVGGCTYRRIWMQPTVTILNATTSDDRLVSGIVQVGYKSVRTAPAACPGRKDTFSTWHYSITEGTKRNGTFHAIFDNPRALNPPGDARMEFIGTVQNGHLVGTLNQQVEDPPGSINVAQHDWPIK